jgi:hypothetical protein
MPAQGNHTLYAGETFSGNLAFIVSDGREMNRIR